MQFALKGLSRPFGAQLVNSCGEYVAAGKYRRSQLCLNVCSYADAVRSACSF